MGNFLYRNFLMPSIDKNANDFQRFMFWLIASCVGLFFLIVFLTPDNVSAVSTRSQLDTVGGKISINTPYGSTTPKQFITNASSGNIITLL